MSADGSVKQNGVGDQGRKNCTITGTRGGSESVGLQGQFEADALVTSLPSAVLLCYFPSLCTHSPSPLFTSYSATANRARIRVKYSF